MKDFLRPLPGAVRFWRWVKGLRHTAVLRFGKRRNYTFTQFCRLPTQVELLAGPVASAVGAPLRIVLFGCSTGAEAYSLASALHARDPAVPWSIECFDIDAQVLARARAASYGADELSRRGGLPPGFRERTFDAVGDRFVVKPELRTGVRFELGNVLDQELMGRLGSAGLVVAQNFLYHLPRPDCVAAFRHLIGLVRPGGALAVDGADLDLRTRCTVEAGLEPWADQVERIHEEARDERGYAWPGIYWGLEPYDRGRPDAVRRYATIFVRPATPAAGRPLV